MLIYCHHCRAPMTIPDQAAYVGGSFFCPNCRAQNIVGGQVQLGASTNNAAHLPSQPSSAKTPRHTVALAVLVVTAGVGLFLPWVSAIAGLALLALSVLYVKQKNVQSTINRILELNQAGQVLTILRAALVGVWSIVALIGFPIWLAIDREVERREAAQIAEENRVKAQQAAEATREAEARAAAEAEAKRIAREQELVAGAADAAADFESTMDTVESKIGQEKWIEAKATLATIEGSVALYRGLNDKPATITDAIARYDKLHARIVAVNDVFERAAAIEREFQAGLDLTKGTKDGEQWKTAQAHWQRAAADVDKLAKVEGEAAKYVPANLAALRKKIDAKLKSAEKIVQKYEQKLAAAAKKLEQERAAAEAYVALCGPKPICGGWDGECQGIESALKRVAHDPRSIDVEDCTSPILSTDDCWVTTCNVRGKNGFGALVLSKKTFSLSKLGVFEL